jgi:shikimate kinase
MEWMNENGFTVWIAPPPEVLVMRLKRESHSRPLIAGLQDDELKVQVEERLNARDSYYRQAKLIITNPSISVQELHEQILHAQALL